MPHQNIISISNKSDLEATIKVWKNGQDRIAFVPTMGALHDGHLSLVELALKNVDKVIVSIFVNPTQFAPHEDLDTYPRDIAGDTAKLEGAGAHAVYLPDVKTIYPEKTQPHITAGKAAQGLEGEKRPTHFDGVVTVLDILFKHITPDVAVFGEKDFQQLQVIREMVGMQNLPIEIIGAPINRDEHGLALSSRNAYLSDDELKIARQLNVILRDSETPEDAEKAILAVGFNKVDYVAERWNRRLVAAWLGKTRLIDNIAL